MKRDRLLHRQTKERTDRFEYKINSDGHTNRVNMPHEDAYNKREPIATITFVDEKLYAILFNFKQEDCSNLKFWAEIHAAVADEISNIEASYMLDDAP